MAPLNGLAIKGLEVGAVVCVSAALGAVAGLVVTSVGTGGGALFGVFLGGGGVLLEDALITLGLGDRIDRADLDGYTITGLVAIELAALVAWGLAALCGVVITFQAVVITTGIIVLLGIGVMSVLP